jgi:DoxX-like family
MPPSFRIGDCMTVFLWVLQGVLAAFFVVAAIPKLAQPIDKQQKSQPVLQDYSPMTIRFIGSVELLGAIGLIAPPLTGIVPVLAPLAATGLAVVMVLAAIAHARRREFTHVAVNVVLLIIAVVVAWGRFGPYSF